MERIINVKVSGNHLTKDGKNAGTRGEANATILRITFDEGWDGYAKSVVFLDAHGMNPTRFTLTTNLLENAAESTRIYLVPIPPASLAVAGEMSFSIDGYIDGKRQRSVIAMLEVEDGIITDVVNDPTPTQAEQLQAQYESIIGDIQQAAIYRNEAEAFAGNAESSAQAAEQTKGDVEALKQETIDEVEAIELRTERSVSRASSYADDAKADRDRANELANEANSAATRAKESADNSDASATKAEACATRAENALGKTNYIGENGNWYAWDSENDAFYDTGVKAKASVSAVLENDVLTVKSSLLSAVLINDVVTIKI